jgi:multiple sugar transport system ATP-binding protein
MTLGDRVCVMRDGVVQQVDTPDRLFSRPCNMFVAGFIGSPEMNFAAGRIQGHTLYMGSHVFPLPAGTKIAGYDGKKVVVGLRPTDIRETGGPDTVEMRVEVELIERLGSEILVVFPLDAPAISADSLADPDTILGDGRTSFTARLDASAPAARGRGLSLFVEPAAVHLFDPATGLAIGRNDP